MKHPIVFVALALSLAACSSLTKPNEITITAEPRAGANADPPVVKPTPLRPVPTAPPAAAGCGVQ